MELFNVNDVPWHDAPLPRRLHRCRTQTSGLMGLTLVERCACGAIRLDGRGPWADRNTRREVKPA